MPWQGRSWDTVRAFHGSLAGDTDPHCSCELQILMAVEGEDELRASLGVGNINIVSKVTSASTELLVQKGEVEGGALNFRVLMPLMPSSVGKWLKEDLV